MDNRIEEIKRELAEYDKLIAKHPEWYGRNGKFPEWLRYLLQQNEQQKAEIERLRGELERYEERRQTAALEVGKLVIEHDQVKAERDDYRKVLEWYADIDAYTVIHLGCSPMVMSDRGKLACDILSRYPEKGE